MTFELTKPLARQWRCLDEAARLSVEKGGKFEVFSRVGGAEVVR